MGSFFWGFAWASEGLRCGALLVNLLTGVGYGE